MPKVQKQGKYAQPTKPAKKKTTGRVLPGQAPSSFGRGYRNRTSATRG